METSIEIFWEELSGSTQVRISDLLGIAIDKIEEAMNWDTFPVTTVYFDQDEIRK